MGTFAQAVDARPLQGVKFKVQAAVRVEALDPSAWACIWVRMDAKARVVLLGGYTTNRGYFYFDDFHFYTRKDGGPWEEMPLPAGGFEDDTAMAGEKDVIREEHTRQIAAHIPGSQLKIFQGGTHQFPEDDPATFNKTVIGFLSQ